MTDQKNKIEIKTAENETALDKYEWASLANIRGRFDHLVDELYESWPFKGARRGDGPSLDRVFDWGFNSPAIDFVDHKKFLELKAELPGLDKDDINVEVTDHMLTISGEKREEREEGEEGGNYYLAERRYGSFKRSVSLPKGVDTEKVDATFKKGVLAVTLQKTAEAMKRPKKIEVKA